MFEPTFTCYAQHSLGGASEIRFSTSPGDGPAASHLPTTEEVAAALNGLFQEHGYTQLYFYGVWTEDRQVYPAPETGV